jgi:mannose-6-phosphate isomerase-like protein (cupin superfamily)
MSSIRILDVNKDYVEIPLLKSGKMAKAIVHPGMGAKYGSLNYIVMEPGDENILHVHPNSDDVFYIIQGEGVVVDGDGDEKSLKAGDVVFVPAGTFHAVKPRGPKTFIGVGGPQPPDVAMLNRGWKGK